MELHLCQITKEVLFKTIVKIGSMNIKLGTNLLALHLVTNNVPWIPAYAGMTVSIKLLKPTPKDFLLLKLGTNLLCAILSVSKLSFWLVQNPNGLDSGRSQNDYYK